MLSRHESRKADPFQTGKRTETETKVFLSHIFLLCCVVVVDGLEFLGCQGSFISVGGHVEASAPGPELVWQAVLSHNTDADGLNPHSCELFGGVVALNLRLGGDRLTVCKIQG